MATLWYEYKNLFTHIRDPNIRQATSYENFVDLYYFQVKCKFGKHNKIAKFKVKDNKILKKTFCANHIERKRYLTVVNARNSLFSEYKIKIYY